MQVWWSVPLIPQAMKDLETLSVLVQCLGELNNTEIIITLVFISYWIKQFRILLSQQTKATNNLYVFMYGLESIFSTNVFQAVSAGFTNFPRLTHCWKPDLVLSLGPRSWNHSTGRLSLYFGHLPPRIARGPASLRLNHFLCRVNIAVF